MIFHSTQLKVPSGSDEEIENIDTKIDPRVITHAPFQGEPSSFQVELSSAVLGNLISQLQFKLLQFKILQQAALKSRGNYLLQQPNTLTLMIFLLP